MCMVNKGVRFGLYMPDDFRATWEQFQKYSTAMNTSAAKMIREFVKTEVARWQGKDPKVTSKVELESLEKEFEKTVREAKDLSSFLKKEDVGDCYSSHRSALDFFTNLVFKELGLKNDLSNLDDVVSKLYDLNFRKDERFEKSNFGPDHLELGIQLLKKAQKKRILREEIKAVFSQGKKVVAKIEAKVTREIFFENYSKEEHEESKSENESVPDPVPNPGPEPEVEPNYGSDEEEEENEEPEGTEETQEGEPEEEAESY